MLSASEVDMTALGAESVFFSHTILVYPEPLNIGQKPGLDATHCVKVYTQWEVPFPKAVSMQKADCLGPNTLRGRFY